VDVWSKKRGETLAKANHRISDRMLNSAFASFRDSDPFFGPRSRGRLGLWFYNSGAGCYTFLPFFYGFGSPYGSSYSTSVYGGYGISNTGSTGWPNSRGSGGGRTYPSGGGGNGAGSSPRPAPAPISSPSGRERVMDPDTGRPMPRKNMERMPNN
jgi:hypothetical protein